MFGGRFDVPHAETHTVILPHAVAYNERTAGEALRPVARILGTNTAANGLYALARRLGPPVSFRELGMPLEEIERAAELAVAAPYANPRPLEREGIRGLSDDAFHGRTPRQAAQIVLESSHA